MKKRLKFLSAVLGALVLCLGLCVFAGCDENYADDSTYSGTFSREEFTSEQDAVKGFEKELGGEMYKVTVLKYSHESKIPKSRIKVLNTQRLGEGEEVSSGRRVLVTCAKKSNASASAAAEEKSFSAEIYEVKLGDMTHFRYYINKCEYEGMIPKTYFDELDEVGDNFTYKSTMTTTVKAAGEEQTVTMKRSAEVDGDRASLHVSQNMINMWLYAEHTDDATKCWVSTDGEEYTGGEDLLKALGSLGIDMDEEEESDFISSEAGVDVDHTYFELAEDNTFRLRSVCEERFLEDLTEQLKGNLGTTSGKLDFNGSVTFDFETDEHGITHLVCEVKATINILGVSIQETVMLDSSFSKVGTTTVERPEGIKD